VPILKPIIQCSIEDLSLNTSHFKNIQFQNFEVFNETEVAVVHSKIYYECNDRGNSSEIIVLSCNQNGLWIGDQNKCRNKSIF